MNLLRLALARAAVALVNPADQAAIVATAYLSARRYRKVVRLLERGDAARQRGDGREADKHMVRARLALARAQRCSP